MPQAEDALAYVFTGIWRNESLSWVRGNVLTMTPRTANILTAILALLLQAAGSQVWHICQVALHQYRATAGDRDLIYWQIQVVLRNIHTALDALTRFLSIASAGRHQPSARPSIWLLLWPIVHIWIFTLLGVFVSNFLNTGDEKIIRPPSCGTYNDTYVKSTGDTTAIGMPNHLAVEWRAHLQTRFSRSQHYYEFCSTLPSGCNDLPHGQIPLSTLREDNCPFSPELCHSGVPTIKVDTGVLDSNQHFGINSRESDRVLFRKVTSCAPLDTTRYMTDWQDVPATDTSPAKKVVRVHLGQNPLADGNATYVYSDFAKYFAFDQYFDTLPYQINVQKAMTGDTDLALSDFYPIAELQNPDADLMLVLLSFNKFYNEPVRDPWFSATKAGAYPLINGSDTLTGTVYSREKPVSALACTEQYQVCTPPSRQGAAPDCTELTGFLPLISGPAGLDLLELNSHQLQAVQRVLQSAADSRLPLILAGLSQRDPPLLARRLIQGAVGLGLPDDQWQLETEYWHAISMVNMQRAVIEYATGEFAADTSYINTTSTPDRQWLCTNQTIRTRNYISFNFVGVMVVITLTSFIIVVGLCIEPLLELWHLKRDPNSAKSKSWHWTEMLNMARRILSRTERGRWSLPSGSPRLSPSGKFNIDDFGMSVGSLTLSSLQPSPRPPEAGTRLKDEAGQ